MKNNNDVNKIYKGKCVDLSFEGKGVFKGEGKTIFVPNMYIGEEGEVELIYTRNGACFGKLRKLNKLSPDRTNPICPICSACGGCCFGSLSYEAQLQYKQNKVKEQFRRIAKMDVDVMPTVGMENPSHYRNKIQVPFGKDKKGNIVYGFYKEGSHQIVPIDDCYIEDSRAKHILAEIKRLLKEFKLEPYNEDSGFGLLRHVLIRTSYYFKQVMVVLVTSIDSFPGRNNFVKALISSCPEITTLVQNINKRHTNVILGDLERVLYGKGFIIDSLCGLKFKISAKSFYQTNPIMTEKLYNAAMKAANLNKNDVVFDAYSGIGTIGLIASKSVNSVISVEIVKEAVRDAINNAKENGINNFKAICADASDYIDVIKEQNAKIDVLFMDPPRKGSDKRFLDAVLKLEPSRVVYISCDPSTLARDVSYLSKKYMLSFIKPFDMFPCSFHIETVVLLTKIMK